MSKLDLFFSPRTSGLFPRREFLLHGMGGVGKTELALKVAQELGDRYVSLVPTQSLLAALIILTHHRFQYVFFIDGSTAATISQSYANISEHHNLGGGGAKAMKSLAMNWIEGLRVEWLMIFDDFNLADRRTELPGKGKGNIIYTSRLTTLKSALGRDSVLEVTPLREAEAIEFLIKASVSQNISLNDLDDDVKAAAQDIVRELGCLPLAIHKAAASVRDGSSRSLGQYLGNLRAKKVRLKTDPHFREQQIENLAVYATLELSCDTMMAIRRREGRASGRGLVPVAALKVLHLLSFYHHKDIPVAMVTLAAESRRSDNSAFTHPLHLIDQAWAPLTETREDGTWDSTNFLLALDMLCEFSFVTLAKPDMTISMHVLVKQWAQHRLGAAHGQWCLTARILVSESLKPTMEIENETMALRLRPHIEACFTTVCYEPFPSELYASMLFLHLGWYHTLAKDFTHAVWLMKSAIQSARVRHGKNDWTAVAPMRNLARLYHEMGRLDDAERTYRELIDRIDDRCKAKSDWLASLPDGEDIPQPQPSDKEGCPVIVIPAASPSGDSAPPTPSRFAARCSKLLARGLPMVASWSGSSVEIPHALRPPEESLSFPHRMTDLDDPINLNGMSYCSYAELALVFLDQGKHAKGKRILVEMVARLQNEVGSDVPEIKKYEYYAKRLTDSNNLLYWEAEMEKALALTGEDRRAFWNHECSHALRVGHADALVENEEWADAAALLRVTKRRVLSCYGPADRRMLDILRLEVTLNIATGEYDAAVPVAKRCVRQAELTYGRVHKETVLAMERLIWALSYHRLDFFDDECKALIHDAIERASVAMGDTHVVTRRMRLWLERAAEKSAVDEAPEGFKVEFGPRAENIFQENVDQMTADLGPHHPISKRLAALSGPNVARSEEDFLNGIRGAFGPESEITKKLTASFATRHFLVAKAMLQWLGTQGTLVIRPGRWETLMDGIGRFEGLWGVESPICVSLRTATAEGPVNTLAEFLERVQTSFGPDRAVTKEMEEMLEAVKAEMVGATPEDARAGPKRKSRRSGMAARRPTAKSRGPGRARHVTPTAASLERIPERGEQLERQAARETAR